MKKITTIVLSLFLIVTLIPTSVFANTKVSEELSSDGLGAYYERPEAEVDAELEAMAAQSLAVEQMRSASDNIITGGNVPTYEYQTIMRNDKTQYTYIDKLASGQLAGGYRVNGALYYDPNGGSSYSFSVSLGVPWGSVGFSGSTGKKAVSGMTVNLPDDKYYYVISAKKTYKSVPYENQRRLRGSNDPWVTTSYGVVTTYFSVYAYPKKV